ncbi:MAG: flagellar hook-basal body complex protein FliE [Treponema sp.]|nr:flagellar hook-basal body complex protein FliE [Spirochaetia bacterium]MDY4903057.1 flagellar hook-basal body complex protein FliE [Treponema sp.]
MNFSFGTLELARTNAAHIGSQPLLKNIGNLNIDAAGNLSDSPVKQAEHKGLFEQYLMEAVEGVNSQQVNVANLREKAITDPDSVDIHDITTAMAKASMSLSLAKTVIDRVIDGWQELSQNR